MKPSPGPSAWTVPPGTGQTSAFRIGTANQNPTAEPAATARRARKIRVRSSDRWSTSVMTVSSPGEAAPGAGAGAGDEGGGTDGERLPGAPASRTASASAMDD